jgi:tight adherence protein C
MLEMIDRLAATMGIDPRLIVVAGLLSGAFLVILGIVIAVRDGGQIRARRLAADAALEPETAFVAPERAPTGLAKAFLPTQERERSQVRRDLAHAGFNGPNAVPLYYGLRSVFGLLLPMAMATVVLLRDSLPLPPALHNQIAQIDLVQMLLVFAVVISVGFYGPAVWLSARARKRREQIEMGFPNALDLLQIAIEAGMGFDAALARVAEEIATASPEISGEFRLAQQEILAGRDRELAYRTMADRLAIDEAIAFVNVVLQSLRFGTSMGQALLAYSDEMRQRREIRAQEKANKLPVYMSGVMAALMMPALLIVTIGPVVIRYIRGF